jgi:2'-deoxynucleoside 5'-phosphate N-hydrolase
MTIFFTASLRAKSSFRQEYLQIINFLRPENTVIADHVIGLEADQVQDWDPEYRFEFYQDILYRIKQADLIIAEISSDSINICYEISIALSQRKQVIALYKVGHEPKLLTQLGEIHSESRLFVIEYSLANLAGQLGAAVQEAKHNLMQRFTLLLPTNLVNYLEQTAGQAGLSKAVYLRKLIEADMV